MRIISANLQHGRTAHGTIGDLREVGEELADLHPDVVTVQEVDYRQRRSQWVDQTRELAAGLHWPQRRSRLSASLSGQLGIMSLPARPDLDRPAWKTVGPLLAASAPAVGGYGVALLTAHPVGRWGQLRLGSAPARIRRVDRDKGTWGLPWRITFGENRSALAADIEVDGTVVRVGTTHLELGRDTARAQLYRLWSSLNREWEAPALLTGDFNLPAQIVQHVTGVPEERDAHAPTFPVSHPTEDIDHVLCSPEWKITHIDTRALSVGDHRALIVDLAHA